MTEKKTASQLSVQWI